MKQQNTDFFSWNFLLLKKKKGYQKRRNRAFISHYFLKTDCFPPTYLSGKTNKKSWRSRKNKKKENSVKNMKSMKQNLTLKL